MNENNDDGGSKIALSHDKDAFYMYIIDLSSGVGRGGLTGRQPPPLLCFINSNSA